MCDTAPPRFVFKIIYLVIIEANAPKFISLKIGLVKFIQAAAILRHM
jgi:hypothetical protein